jgi:hypothetical protein
MIKGNKFVFKFIILLISIYGALSYFINSSYTKKTISKSIYYLIEKNTPYKTNKFSIQIQTLPIGISIYNLHLQTKDKNKQNLHLIIPKTDITISLASLLLGNNKFVEIKLHEAFLQLSNQQTTTTNSSSLSFSNILVANIVKKIQIINSKLFLKIKNKNIHDVNINNLNSTITSTSINKIQSSHSLEQIYYYENDNSKLENFSLKFKLNFESSSFTIKNIRIYRKDTYFRGRSITLNKEAFKNNLNLLVRIKGYSDLRVLGTYLDIKNTSGKISTSLSVKINTNKRTKILIQGEAKTTNAIMDNYKINDAKIIYTITDKGMHFNKIFLIKKSKQLGTGKGYIGFNKEVNYWFQANIKNTTLNKLLLDLDVNMQQFNFDIKSTSVSIKGKGTPFHMEITGPALLKKIKLKDIKRDNDKNEHCSFNLNLKINNLSTVFKNTNGFCYTDIDTLNSLNTNKISISGNINYKSPSKISISLQDFDHSIIGNILPIDIAGIGKSNTDIFIDKKTKIASTLELSNATLLGFYTKNLRGKLDFTDNTLTIYKSFGFMHKQNSSFWGKVDFNKQWVNLNFSGENIEKIQTNNLFKNVGLTITANIKKVKMELSGPLNNPLDNKLYLDIDANKISSKTNMLLQNIKAKIVRNKKSTKISNCTIKSGFLTTLCQGNIVHKNNPTDKKKIIGTSDIINFSFFTPKDKKQSGDFHNIPLFKNIIPYNSLKATTNIKGNIEGVYSKLYGNLQIQLSNITANNVKIPTTNINAILNSKNIEINIDQDGGSSQGKSTIDITDPNYTFNFYSKLYQFDLRFLTNNIFHRAHDFILLDGTLKAKGSLKHLRLDDGIIEIDNIAAKYNLSKSAIDLYLTNKTSILLPLSKNKGQKIHLQGKYNEVNLQIQNNKIKGYGTIKPSLLENFPPIKQAKGLIKFIFSYDIKHKNLWNLQLSPKQKNTLNILVKETYPDINIHDFLLEFSPKKINLKHLSATKGSGKITGRGTLSTDSKTTNGISLDFNKIKFKSKLSYIRNIDSLLNGNIIITGNKPPYKIIGNIFIDESKSIDTHDIINEIATITNKTNLSRNTTLTEHLSPKIDINIFCKKYTINNRSIKATGAFDLSAQGNFIQPKIKGKIHIDRGSFIYKREFALEKSNIIFDGQSNLDPEINLIAATTISPYIVTLSLQGKLKNLNVNFKINPSLNKEGKPITQSQIIYLVFNGILPEQTDQELSSAGMQMLSNQITNIVTLNVLEKVFTDIHLYPGWITDSKGTSPGFTLSWKLYRDLKLYLKKSRQNTNLTLTLPIKQHIDLTTEFSQASTSDSTLNNNQNTNALNSNLQMRFHFGF